MKNRGVVLPFRMTCLVFLALTSIGISEQTLQVFQGTGLEKFLSSAKIIGLKGIGIGVTLPQKATAYELDKLPGRGMASATVERTYLAPSTKLNAGKGAGAV